MSTDKQVQEKKRPSSPLRRILYEVFDFARFIAIVALVIMLFKSSSAQVYTIPSASMRPGLLIGDFVLVTKFDYGYSVASLPRPLGNLDIGGRVGPQRSPRRGEVVVFRNQRQKGREYIKRVIGLPGDHIRLEKGRIWLNGQILERNFLYYEVGYCRDPSVPAPLYEEVLPEGTSHVILECSGDAGLSDSTGTYIVPENHFFMMGDNRDDSQDSRFVTKVGYVSRDALVGKARRVIFSIDGEIFRWWKFWKWGQSFRWGRSFDSLADIESELNP